MNALPNETLLKCFHYLNWTSDVDSVRGSCRRFRDIVDSHSKSLYNCKGRMVVTVYSPGSCVVECSSGVDGIIMYFGDYICWQASYSKLGTPVLQHIVSTYLPGRSFQECVQFCTRTLSHLNLEVSHLSYELLLYLEKYIRHANSLSLTTTDLEKEKLHEIVKIQRSFISKENLIPEILEDNYFEGTAIERLDLRFPQNLTMEQLQIIISRPQLKAFSFCPDDFPTVEFIKTLCQELLQSSRTKQVQVAFDDRNVEELIHDVRNMSLVLNTGEIVHVNRIAFDGLNFRTWNRRLDLLFRRLLYNENQYGIRMCSGPASQTE